MAVYKTWMKIQNYLPHNLENKKKTQILKFLAGDIKVALQILGRKFYKNTKKTSLYSQSILIFIHKTPVVENHPTTGEIRPTRLTPMGITVYFYVSSSLIYTLEIHRSILWNLSVISHLIFLQCCF